MKKWIQAAGIQKGGLHRSLGIPQGQKIPPSRIAAAANKPGLVGKQARLAETFAGMRHAHHQVHQSNDARPSGKKTAYKN